jgi:hypothetical protein
MGYLPSFGHKPLHNKQSAAQMWRMVASSNLCQHQVYWQQQFHITCTCADLSDISIHALNIEKLVPAGRLRSPDHYPTTTTTTRSNQADFP